MLYILCVVMFQTSSAPSPSLSQQSLFKSQETSRGPKASVPAMPMASPASFVLSEASPHSSSFRESRYTTEGKEPAGVPQKASEPVIAGTFDDEDFWEQNVLHDQQQIGQTKAIGISSQKKCGKSNTKKALNVDDKPSKDQFDTKKNRSNKKSNVDVSRNAVREDASSSDPKNDLNDKTLKTKSHSSDERKLHKKLGEDGKKEGNSMAATKNTAHQIDDVIKKRATRNSKEDNVLDDKEKPVECNDVDSSQNVIPMTAPQRCGRRKSRRFECKDANESQECNEVANISKIRHQISSKVKETSNRKGKENENDATNKSQTRSKRLKKDKDIKCNDSHTLLAESNDVVEEEFGQQIEQENSTAVHLTVHDVDAIELCPLDKDVQNNSSLRKSHRRSVSVEYPSTPKQTSLKIISTIVTPKRKKKAVLASKTKVKKTAALSKSKEAKNSSADEGSEASFSSHSSYPLEPNVQITSSQKLDTPDKISANKEKLKSPGK